MQSLEQLDQFTLTGLDNRNRYMELLEAGKENALKQVGGIYMDLNGLKRCNDCFGHAAGDALICRAADALNDVFPGEACRIGGDEFVVICCPVTQEKFEQQVEALRAALVRHQVDAAIGSFWQSLVEDLPAFLRAAARRRGGAAVFRGTLFFLSYFAASTSTPT